MSRSKTSQGLSLVSRSPLTDHIRDFLIDCQARRLSPATVERYGRELRQWREWLEAQGVDYTDGITAPILRAYMSHLAGYRNAGGQHLGYRVIRTYLRWYEREYEPRAWANPLGKVRPPKLPQDIQPPLDLGDFQAMLATCKRTYDGQRARAMLLMLLDTGCRASEFVGLNVGDVDLSTGSVMVRHGKGGKDRVTFVGARTRRELVRYLRGRQTAPDDPLWCRRDGRRLTYWGLRQVVRWRAKAAGVPEPGLHSFRRAFALASLRAGADLVSLSRLLGHADLSLLRRYTRQVEDDLRRVHGETGPVDHLL